jgi:hypothetical protein
MKVSSYPGRSLEGAALDYAASIPGVTPLPELHLAEREDGNCCGPSAAPSVNHHLSLALGRPQAPVWLAKHLVVPGPLLKSEALMP